MIVVVVVVLLVVLVLVLVLVIMKMLMVTGLTPEQRWERHITCFFSAAKSPDNEKLSSGWQPSWWWWPWNGNQHGDGLDVGNCHVVVVTETIFSCGEMGRVLEGTKQASPCRSGDTFGHFDWFDSFSPFWRWLHFVGVWGWYDDVIWLIMSRSGDILCI